MRLFARLSARKVLFFVLTVLVLPFFNPIAHASSAPYNKSTTENLGPYLVDQCVGGTAHELVAQANIVTTKKFPEYGLSEALSVACPRFVWVVLQADSLPASEKKRAFSNVINWTQAEKMKFFAPLKQEVDEAAEQAWRQDFKE